MLESRYSVFDTMKNHLLFIILLSVLFVFPANYSKVGEIKIVEKGPQGLTIEFCPAELQIKKKKIQREFYSTVALADAGVTQEPGKPQLPVQGALIAVPPLARVGWEILEEKIETFDNILICPAPRRILETEDSASFLREEFTLDRTCYAQDHWMPEKPVIIEQEGYLRYQKVARLSIYPVQYNPALQKMRFYKNLKIKITFDNIPQRLRRSITVIRNSDYQPFWGEFEQVLENTLLNYSMEESRQLLSISPEETIRKRKEPSFSELPPLKIAVEQEGLYRISGTDLHSAGWDLNLIIPQKLALSNKGQQVPIKIIGAKDGVFHPDDQIKFWGCPVDSEFTRTNIYWLYQENTAEGLRIQCRNGAFGNAGTAKDYFTEHLHWEENNLYWQTIPDGEGKDHWFWEQLSPPASNNFPMQLYHIAPGDMNCELQLFFQGKTNTSFFPDHHLVISLNGTKVDDFSWDGQIEYLRRIEISQGILQEGSNTVTIEALAQAGNPVDIIYVNWIKLAYPRRFMANDNQLIFSLPGEGVQDVQIDGFTEKELSVFDVDDPCNITALEDITVEKTGPSQYRVKFTDTLKGAQRYAILGIGREKKPLSLELDHVSSLRSERQGADYIMITHSSLYESILPLAEHRRSQGLRVKVVDVQDIYDEFSAGIFTPQAIRDFLKYCFQNWTPPAPLYVLLVGDANMDYLDHFRKGRMNFVPTHIYHTPEIGETPNDNWFVCVNGEDILPDMFLGRISIRTPEEAQKVGEKIISYEQQENQPWHQRALFVAGSGDSSYTDIPDSLAQKFLPGNFELQKVYKGNYADVSLAKEDLKQKISQGCLLTTYTGHGSTDQWSGLFTIKDVASLHNIDKPAFVLTFTCLNGFFPHPEADYCLAEELLRAERKGALACFAPINVEYPANQSNLSAELFDLIFKQKIRRLGVCTTSARINSYVQNKVSANTLQSYMLFGDPATELKGRLGPSAETQILIKPGINVFCLPGKMENSWKVSDLQAYANTQGIELQKISAFDSLHHRWQIGGWQNGGFQGEDFEIIPGQSYILYAEMKNDLTLPLTCSDIYPRYTWGIGSHWINFPAPLHAFTSYDLLEELGEKFISSLQTLDAPGGKWQESYYFFGMPAGKKSRILKDTGYLIEIIDPKNNWRPSVWDEDKVLR